MPHIHTQPGQVDHTVEVFVVCGGNVLLRKHDKYGIWLSVGGHIELDEDPNQAALREVKEEVGLDVELYSRQKLPANGQKDYRELIPPVFLNRHRINDSHEHVTYTYFAASQTQVVSPEKSTDEWRWATKAELSENKYGLKPHIRRYALAALEAFVR